MNSEHAFGDSFLLIHRVVVIRFRCLLEITLHNKEARAAVTS